MSPYSSNSWTSADAAASPISSPAIRAILMRVGVFISAPIAQAQWQRQLRGPLRNLPMSPHLVLLRLTLFNSLWLGRNVLRKETLQQPNL